MYETWATGEGIVTYDPRRPGLKKKNGPGWSVLQLAPGFTAYYRWLLERSWWDARDDDGKFAMPGKMIELQAPSWGDHISITRGEYLAPEIKHLWKSRHGQKIKFEYSLTPRMTPLRGDKEDVQFWFVDVKSDDLMEIRAELLLPTHFKFHLTIGRRDL